MVILGEKSFISKFFSADLTPTSRGSTKIDDPLSAFKNLEQIINLEEFVCRPCSIALFFGLSIVDVLN